MKVVETEKVVGDKREVIAVKRNFPFNLLRCITEYFLTISYTSE